MKQLQENEPGVFKTSNPAPGNTGGTGNHPRVGDGAITKEQFNKMTYKERVDLFNSNKELYNQLK